MVARNERKAAVLGVLLRDGSVTTRSLVVRWNLSYGGAQASLERYRRNALLSRIREPGPGPPVYRYTLTRTGRRKASWFVQRTLARPEKQRSPKAPPREQSPGAVPRAPVHSRAVIRPDIPIRRVVQPSLHRRQVVTPNVHRRRVIRPGIRTQRVVQPNLHRRRVVRPNIHRPGFQADKK